jgi:Acyclic terpene utilisation family protein AtuA
VQALAGGADIVITGRVADPSLVVGPCVHHFGWKADDFDKIAGATVAGHLIECGTQVTGGISTDWLAVPRAGEIGFPIVEVAKDGSCVVTKPAGSGGVVDRGTVSEQLLYEIGDPENYMSPDAMVSFGGLRLEEDGTDRIRVVGAKGRRPPATYKVSATYRVGYRAAGTLMIFGRDAAEKARRCGEIVLARLAEAGLKPQRSLVECLGAGDVVKGMARSDPLEVVLRIAVADSRREVVEKFARQMVPLVTAGPQGTTGYAEGRPVIREEFAYWPTLIAREQVKPSVEVIEV